MIIERVGVVGAGVIGSGVAQSLAETGHTVICVDVSLEALERAKTEIRNNLRLQRLYKKADETKDPDQVLAKIDTSTDLRSLQDTDFVVENVTERWEVKKEVFREMDAVCHQGTVFASNTSAIPITRIAGATNRPSKVLGIHFMNPVPLKPIVELVAGFHTSDETIEYARRLLSGMGKEGILVNDSPGFVSNRVLMPFVNEAAYLVHERVAPPEDIDRLFKTCFEHKMGPLETADLIGLDTVLLSIEVLYDRFKDPKYRPCPLLQEKVDAGVLGRKSGEGFYTY